METRYQRELVNLCFNYFLEFEPAHIVESICAKFLEKKYLTDGQSNVLIDYLSQNVPEIAQDFLEKLERESSDYSHKLKKHLFIRYLLEVDDNEIVAEFNYPGKIIDFKFDKWKLIRFAIKEMAINVDASENPPARQPEDTQNTAHTGDTKIKAYNQFSKLREEEEERKRIAREKMLEEERVRYRKMIEKNPEYSVLINIIKEDLGNNNGISFINYYMEFYYKKIGKQFVLTTIEQFEEYNPANIALHMDLYINGKIFYLLNNSPDIIDLLPDKNLKVLLNPLFNTVKIKNPKIVSNEFSVFFEKCKNILEYSEDIHGGTYDISPVWYKDKEQYSIGVRFIPKFKVLKNKINCKRVAYFKDISKDEFREIYKNNQLKENIK